MKKPSRSRKQKSESSDDEEDFESADEGEGSSPSPSNPPSLEATSPDNHKNSTSQSQVTNDTSNSTMASSQSVSSIITESSQDTEKRYEDTEMFAEVETKKRTTEFANLETTDDRHDTVSDTTVSEDKQASNEDNKLLDDTKDSEIQFKIAGKDCVDEPCELDDTQTSPDDGSTLQHKETIENRITQEENVSLEEKVGHVDNEEKHDSEFFGEQSAEQTEECQKGIPDQQASCESSWGWGSWGTMLSQASAGLSHVIESVESSLGIPEPEEIAKKVVEEDEKSSQSTDTVIQEEPKTKEVTESSIGGSEQAQGEKDQGSEADQGSFFSVFGVPGLSNVVSEGLGALEFIGKKTMDVITDGDAGLRNKREQLLPKNPTLSQILREAKEDAEYKATHPDYKASVMNVKLTTEFDKYQGLAHLEALEILSKGCEVKVESHIINLTKEELVAIKPLLRAIQEVVQIEDEEDEEEEEQDFENEITSCLAELHLSHVPNKTKIVHSKIKEWIETCLTEQTETPKCKDHVEIYTAAIASLAELTASSVEQFHKVAEVLLLLVEERSTSALVRAQTLKKLTLCVCREMSNLASKYAEALNTLSKECEDPEAIQTLITTLYLESSDSCQYVQHAFKLLCPVLQQSSLSEVQGPLES